MELTLLTSEQVFGNNKLEVLKKYDTLFPLTDLAIITGAFYMSHENSKDKTGLYYTQTFNRNGITHIDLFGHRNIEGLFNQRYYTICPVLVSDIVFSLVFADKVKGYNEIEEVEYGEYPQYVPSEDLQKVLESQYQNKNLKPTGRTYTFDNNSGVNKEEQKFQPITYDEYEYNEKKYVRVKFNVFDQVELSNGLFYKQGDYVWVEVSPVVWLIDKEQKLLISKNGILSGIRFNWSRFNFNFNFKPTEVYHYLNKYMIRDLFQSVDLNKEKSVNENVEQKTTSKVELLLEEIKLYINFLPDNKFLKEKINNLIKDYNEKLDRIKNKKNDTLSFETLDSVTNELEMSLNMVLFDLKNVSNYFDIFDYINVCLSCFDKDEQKETIKEDDELISDLNILSNYCIPFLKEEDGRLIKDEVINIFNFEKDKIEKYLNNKFDNSNEKNVKITYSNKEEFIIEIRKSLHPILEKLVDKVSKRDIELEISSATKSIIENTFDSTKEGYLANNFKEISSITKEINSYISEVDDVNKSQEFLLKLSKILSFEFDYKKDTNDIYKQILDVIVSLHKLNLEVREYIKEINKINSSYIKPIK